MAMEAQALGAYHHRRTPPDGSLRFYDPQNGMSGALDLYKKDIAGNVRIYRVDNLAPNANIVKDVLTKGETKAAAGTAAQGGISGGIETKAIFERAKQIKSLVQRDGINPIVLPTLNKTAEVSIKKSKRVVQPTAQTYCRKERTDTAHPRYHGQSQIRRMWHR